MSRIVVLLTLLAACTEPTPSIDVVAFRDPQCGPNAAEDCVVVVPPGTRVELPTTEFELLVHADTELGTIAIDAPVVVQSQRIDHTVDPSGVTDTLLVSPLGFGTIEVESSCGATLDFTSIDPDRALRYGSTYSSNCYCLSCTMYCAVNGKTEKAGTCC